MVFTITGCGEQSNQTPEPLKIVSLAPSNTEIVAALGGIENLVAVTDWCDYPAATANIEKIGDAFNVNYEKIVALQPDIVLLPSAGEVKDRLEELGLEVMVLTSESIDKIYSNIIAIADLLDVKSKGEELVEDMKGKLAELEEGFLTDKPSVFMLVDNAALWTVGNNTFSNEIIIKSGGVNAAAIEEGWFEISQEKLLEIDPDVILYSWPPSEEITSLTAWKNLSAVKEGRVYQIDGDMTSRPGPRIVEGIESIYNLLKTGE